jgi:hypothetical protein
MTTENPNVIPTEAPTVAPQDPPSVDINALLDEKLKGIKENLNNAYAARDAAIKEANELKERERQAELARLEAEGKHKEVYELKLAEEKAKREAAEQRAIQLTRDLELRTALKQCDFKNARAEEIAFGEILRDLTQTADGKWVHRSGVSINDYVTSFSENADNSFLFKPKVNSGGGSSNDTTNNSNQSPSKPKSLFGMSQDEVLKLAREGKLRKR